MHSALEIQLQCNLYIEELLENFRRLHQNKKIYNYI